jgi:TP901 family phage tail tape measure protein
MAKFVLTAQMKLAAPTNTGQIVTQIQNQLKGINANVNVKVNQQALTQLKKVNTALTQTSKSAATAAVGLEKFGKDAALAIRRFGAFVAATFAFRKFVSAVSEGFGEAIKFERELIKIAQVTDTSVRNLKGLTGEITRLSTTFGVSSAKLLQASRILSQTGQSAKETERSLQALAKSDLAPTFDNIINTTEGAIAIFRQFNIEAKDLESTLGSINAVSSKFAVESSDIITAVRRTGGAFSAAGGELNELIALFTSVRATSRESAESIATGFRTIFTRLQRTRTINFLSTLGIDLRDLEGQFVGPLEAIKRLNVALKNVRTTDPRFAQIVEELGGFRQISKVIPLIQQFDEAQKALNVAQQGNTSLSKDAAKAQQALSVQIGRVREEFNQLVRKIAGSSAFGAFAKTALRLASALIKVADALTPLIGILSALAVPLAASGFAKFLGGVKTGKGFLGGLKGFNTGGIVPGSGNRDTVPAALTPGEFVLRKRAVQAIGSDNLQKLNRGGGVQKLAEGGRARTFGGFTEGLSTGKGASTFGAVFLRPDPNRFSGNAIKQQLSTTIPVGTGSKKQNKKINLIGATMPESVREALEDKIVIPRIRKTIIEAGKVIGKEFKSPSTKRPKINQIPNISGITGSIFEGGLATLGPPFDEAGLDDQRGFDFPQGLGGLASKFGVSTLSGRPTDAKRTLNVDSLKNLKRKIENSFIVSKKGASDSFEGNFRNLSVAERAKRIKAANLSGLDASRLDKFLKSDSNNPKFGGSNSTLVAKALKVRTLAEGGLGSGTDTVPALLTPGEFVVNKKSAQRIGLSNLEGLNKVQKFNKGGPVGASGGGGLLNNPAIFLLPSVLGGLVDQFTDMDDSIGKLVEVVTQAGIQFVTFQAILGGFINSARFQSFQNRVPGGFGREQADALARRDAAGARLKAGARANRLSGVGASVNIADRNAFIAANQNVQGLRARGPSFLQRNTTGTGTSVAIGAGLGAVGNVAGGFVTGLANERIARGEEAGTLAGAGGALSGAGTGAAIGALFGPIGIGVGAAVGALAGFVTATSAAKEALEAVNFNKSVENLTTAFDRVAKNQFSAASQSSIISKSFQDLDDRLRTAGTPEELEVLNGAIKNSRTGFEQYISIVSKTATSFNELEAIIGTDTLATFARLNGIPFERFEKGIRSSIELRAKANDVNQESIRVEQEFVASILNLNTVSKAIDNAVLSTNKFTAAINGALKIESLSNIIKGGENINPQAFASAIDATTSSLGPRGTALGAEAKKVNRVLLNLPQIVTSVRAQDPLGTQGDFAGRLISEIQSQTGIQEGDTILKAIEARVAKSIGGEGKEAKLLEDISNIQGLQKFVKDIGSGLSAPSKVLADAAVAINNNVNQLVNATNKRRELEFQILASTQKSADIATQRELFVDSLSGSNNTFAIRNRANRQNQLNRIGGIKGVGVNDPVSAGKELIETQKTLAKINMELADAQDRGLKKDQERVNARDALTSKAKRLTDQLNFLGNTANTTGAALEELGRIRGERRQDFNFALRALTAGPKELAKLNQTILATTKLGTDDLFAANFKNLPNDLKKEIVALANENLNRTRKAFGVDESGEARTGQKFLDRLLRFTKLSGAADPDFGGAKIPSLIEQVKAGFDLSKAANDTLRSVLQAEQNRVINLIGQANDKFLNELRKIFLESRLSEIESNITQKELEKQTVKQQTVSYTHLTLPTILRV